MIALRKKSFLADPNKLILVFPYLLKGAYFFINFTVYLKFLVNYNVNLDQIKSGPAWTLHDNTMLGPGLIVSYWHG